VIIGHSSKDKHFLLIKPTSFRAKQRFEPGNDFSLFAFNFYATVVGDVLAGEGDARNTDFSFLSHSNGVIRTFMRLPKVFKHHRTSNLPPGVQNLHNSPPPTPLRAY